jgi:hypothetical protein
MGELEDYFRANTGRLMTKWRHYFEIYERHFAPYRGKPVRILEFGVWHGGSLRMWRDYFGPAATIVGVDVNPACASLAEPGIDVVIGDQRDPATHRGLRERYGEFDIVIDDGGHTMAQQVTTFLELYAAVSPGGLYVAEDLHSSYLPRWGGALRSPGSFIELGKRMIDQLHAWYGPIPGLQPDYVTANTFALHFYDSMLVLEKRPITMPEPLYSGEPSLPLEAADLRSLAYMDARAGRRELAIEKYRSALSIEPDDADAREQLRILEGTAR